jgi:predicted RNA binding protein YcfA (HicA-like mRNA interferase family)
MTRLPSLKVREIVKGLSTLGFEKVRQKGSHATFHHNDCRRTSIPIHPSRPFHPNLLSDILKQLKIDEDDFLKAIKR